MALIGGCTVINKFGKFFMVIENEKKDGYKKGFDIIMVDSIDEINRCVESVGVISNTCSKIIVTIYDISMGNKVIRKNKEGKIIITEKVAVENNYKNKLDILNNKVKHYEEELKKIKKTKKEGIRDDTEDAHSDVEDENSDAEDEHSDAQSDAHSDSLHNKNDAQNNSLNNKSDAQSDAQSDISDDMENSEDEFYLENKEE